ncbi:hypothetical protein LTR85_009797 [Meristemomyces frigidus]|nr:hypothetical protein LTR85_009797 [Meristemomyces frigidus]
MPALGLSEPAAYVVVTTVTAVVWSLLTLGIRIFLRLKVNGPFGLDDAACGATTFLGVVNSSLTLYQIHFGLGKHASELSKSAVERAHFWSWLNNMFFVVALALSIMSVCFLIARIIALQKKVWVAYGIAIATGLWAVVSIFFFAFMCRLPRPWIFAKPAHCIHRWALYASVDAVKAVLELANIAPAGMLCWTLQMPLRPKIQIVATFSIRLL